MRNELLKWCEDLKKSDTIMISVIDLEAKINSIPVPDVEGYLEDVNDWNEPTSNIGADPKLCMYKSDALAALQALSDDKDAEVKKWFGIAQSELNQKINLACQVSDLTAENERLKGWISVEDRFPELSPPYVKHGITYTPVSEYCIVWDGEYVDLGSYNERGLSNPKATHWMPLPEPPKQ